MRWGAILIAIAIALLVISGSILVKRNDGFLLIYEMDGYQEVYEILPRDGGYVIFGSSSDGAESRCLVTLIDSMGMLQRNILLDGPHCSSAFGGGDSYVIRMYDTVLSMSVDMDLLWKVHLENRIPPDITDLMDGDVDSYYYAVSGSGGRHLHIIGRDGDVLGSFTLADGMGVAVLEVDTCGHVHVALEEQDGGIVLMEVADSGVVWSRVLDFRSLFGSEKGVPVALLWNGGKLYIFADAVRGDVIVPVYVVVMERGEVRDYGTIDRWGWTGNAIVYNGGIAVGYNIPSGGFLIKFFDEEMEPVWSLRSDRGVIRDMTRGYSGQLVMAGNVPEEGNFFSAFVSEDGKWITR